MKKNENTDICSKVRGLMNNHMHDYGRCCMRVKKIGFTLAEVLITLGIIGVVAAMTLPSTMSKYRKSVAENKLKSTYSQLSGMLQFIDIQNNLSFIPDADIPDDVSSEGWSYSYSCDVFDKYFAPNLKIVKELESDTLFSICNYKGEGCYQNASYKCVILANGVGLCTAVNSISGKITFRIILNPGRNILYSGRDAFMFTVSRDISKNDYSMKLGLDKTLSYYSDSARSDFIDACISTKPFPTNIGSGSSDREIFCTALIYRNNWSVPQDYPINF